MNAVLDECGIVVRRKAKSGSPEALLISKVGLALRFVEIHQEGREIGVVVGATLEAQVVFKVVHTAPVGAELQQMPAMFNSNRISGLHSLFVGKCGAVEEVWLTDLNASLQE